MKVRAALALAVLLVCNSADAQPHDIKSPELAEFSRICLDPHTLDFALLDEDARRLGLTKLNNVEAVSPELAEALKLPEGTRTRLIDPGRMMHGVANDPEAFSIWGRDEKFSGLIQRVDAGQGVFGVPPLTFPAQFCTVLAMANAKQVWAAFAASADDAVFMSEKDGGMIWGPMRTWLIDLPWADNVVAIVTIADMTTPWMRGSTTPDGTILSIEVISQANFERLLTAQSDGPI